MFAPVKNDQCLAVGSSRIESVMHEYLRWFMMSSLELEVWSASVNTCSCSRAHSWDKLFNAKSDQLFQIHASPSASILCACTLERRKCDQRPKANQLVMSMYIRLVHPSKVLVEKNPQGHRERLQHRGSLFDTENPRHVIHRSSCSQVRALEQRAGGIFHSHLVDKGRSISGTLPLHQGAREQTSSRIRLQGLLPSPVAESAGSGHEVDGGRDLNGRFCGRQMGRCRG